MMSSVHCWSPWTYNWKIFGVGVAAAVSSSAGCVTELTACMIPNSEAPLVEPAAPSGWNVCNDPIGARIAGIRSFSPRNVVEGSTFVTSTRIRGRNATLSNASRFLRSVVSDSDPPTR
jgi:hypothetical protein